MRRWILALPGLFLALSLTAECKEPPHSLTPYAGAKQSADGGNPAKPPHELKAARQATARQLIAAALDEVKQLTETWEKADAYTYVAKAQVHAGEVSLARKSIETATKYATELRSPCYCCQIADVQALAGDIPGARRTLAAATAFAAEGSSNPNRWDDYVLICHSQVAMGDMEDARKSIDATKKTVEKLDQPWVDSYCHIAEMQFVVGDLAAARQSIEVAKTKASQTRIVNYDPWPTIARAQAGIGDWADAEATLARSSSDSNDLGRPEVNEVIADAQASKHDFAAAKATIMKIGGKHEDNKRIGFLHIAAAQAKAGNAADAKLTADSNTDGAVRAVALHLIGAAQVEAGDLKGALATAASMTVPVPTPTKAAAADPMPAQCTKAAFSAMLYCQIADAQADAGEMAAARQSMSVAGDAARRSLEAANAVAAEVHPKPDEDQSVCWSYSQSADALAMVGNATGAVSTVGVAAKDPRYRCVLLCLIVEDICPIKDAPGGLLDYAGL